LPASPTVVVALAAASKSPPSVAHCARGDMRYDQVASPSPAIVPSPSLPGASDAASPQAAVRRCTATTLDSGCVRVRLSISVADVITLPGGTLCAISKATSARRISFSAFTPANRNWPAPLLDEESLL